MMDQLIEQIEARSVSCVSAISIKIEVFIKKRK